MLREGSEKTSETREGWRKASERRQNQNFALKLSIPIGKEEAQGHSSLSAQHEQRPRDEKVFGLRALVWYSWSTGVHLY